MTTELDRSQGLVTLMLDTRKDPRFHAYMDSLTPQAPRPVREHATALALVLLFHKALNQELYDAGYPFLPPELIAAWTRLYIDALSTALPPSL